MSVVKKVFFWLLVCVCVFVGIGLFGAFLADKKENISLEQKVVADSQTLEHKKQISQKIRDLLKEASVEKSNGQTVYTFGSLTNKGLLNENKFIVSDDGQIKTLSSFLTFRNLIDGVGWDTIYFSSSKGNWKIDVTQYEINGQPSKNFSRNGTVVTEYFFISTSALCLRAYPALLGDDATISFSKKNQMIGSYQVTPEMKMAIINAMMVNEELEKLRKYDGYSKLRLY